MLSTKNGIQPSASASAPPEAESTLSPTVASDDNSAYWVAVNSRLHKQREIGDKGGRGHSAGHVLGGDRQRQHAEIVAGPDLYGVHQVRQRLHRAADEERPEDPDPRHENAAERHPDEGCDDPVDLGDRGDLDLAEAERDIERVRHRAGQRVAEFVEDDEHGDRDQLSHAVAGEEVEERRDDRPAQPRPGALGGGRAGQRLGRGRTPGSGVSHTVTMPTPISAAISA